MYLKILLILYLVIGGTKENMEILNNFIKKFL